MHLWLGQCPLVDYREAPQIDDVEGWGAGHPFSRAHRYCRWFYEYSGGKLTDWGAHHVDIAMLALNKLGNDIGNIKGEPISVEHPVPCDQYRHAIGANPDLRPEGAPVCWR